MQRIPSFDPSQATSNTYIDVGAADAGSKVLLYNESPYNLDLDFLNGSQSILHAWEARAWTLDGDTKQIGWVVDTALQMTGPPISLVMGELYGANEKLEGTYPMALIRQASVGNQVNTNVTSTNTLVNDGNPAPTTILEATPSGQSFSAVLLTNDGSLTLGNSNGPAGQGVLTVIYRILANLIRTITGNDLTLDVDTGHKIALQVNGVDVVDITATLLHSLQGLTVDGATTLTGAVTATNASNNITATSANTATSASQLSGAPFTSLNVPGTPNESILSTPTSGGGSYDFYAQTYDGTTGHAKMLVDHTGVSFADRLNAGTNLAVGKLGVSSDADILDYSTPTGSVYLKHPNNSQLHVQVPNGTNIARFDSTGIHLEKAGVNFDASTAGSPLGVFKYGNGNGISAIGTFGGTGSGTYNHGLPAAPFYVGPIVSVAGSATQGFDSATATQVHITLGSSLAFKAYEYY